MFQNGLRDLSVLNPHVKVKDIAHLDFKRMKDMGFRKIIFDKDNTLTFDEDPYFASFEIRAAMEKAVDTFGYEDTLVISNMSLKRHVRELPKYERPLNNLKFVVEDLPQGWAGRKPFNLKNVERVLA